MKKTVFIEEEMLNQDNQPYGRCLHRDPSCSNIEGRTEEVELDDDAFFDYESREDVWDQSVFCTRCM